MWNLYRLAKETHQTPSQAIELRDWLQAEHPLAVWWTSVQFDQAVVGFGTSVESYLNKYDKKGRPRYHLKDLLADEPEQKSVVKQRVGGVRVVTVKADGTVKREV